MTKLQQLNAFLSGKKTFILGTSTVILGIYMNNTEMIMLGLISMGLRSAIKN